jgi:hypothetical protein
MSSRHACSTPSFFWGRSSQSTAKKITHFQPAASEINNPLLKGAISCTINLAPSFVVRQVQILSTFVTVHNWKDKDIL